MMSLSQLFLILVLPAAANLQGTVEFDKTISRAMERAETEQRELFLYFTSESCTDCATLDAYFSKEDVQKALSNKYVSAKVNIDAFDGNACKDIYDITDVPAIIVVKPDGKITLKKNGGVDPKDIESIILHGTIPELQYEDMVDSENAASSADPAAGDYALQVGFFSSKKNADKLRTEIASRGFDDTRINEEVREDKKFYRVLVGNYNSADYASSDLKTLENSGFSVKVHKHQP